MCPVSGPAPAHAAPALRGSRAPSRASRVSHEVWGRASATPEQVALCRRFGLRSRRRGSALPSEATYRRVSVPDVASCAKKGLFQPSIDPAADHETGLVREPAKREPAKREPAEREPADRRTHGTTTPRNFAPRPAIRDEQRQRERRQRVRKREPSGVTQVSPVRAFRKLDRRVVRQRQRRLVPHLGADRRESDADEHRRSARHDCDHPAVRRVGGRTRSRSGPAGPVAQSGRYSPSSKTSRSAHGAGAAARAVTRSLMRPSRQSRRASRAISTDARSVDGKAGEQALAQFVVDRAAVVGVDEAQVPQLAALVDVRHAGGGEAHERLREAVERAVPGDGLAQLAQVRDRRCRGRSRSHASRSARARPRTPRRDRSSSCAASPRGRPSTCRRGSARVKSASSRSLEGPCAEQVLVEHQLVEPARSHPPRDLPPFAVVVLDELLDDGGIALRERREHADARARVLAVLRVVRRERRQRAGPGLRRAQRGDGAARRCVSGAAPGSAPTSFCETSAGKR